MSSPNSMPPVAIYSQMTRVLCGRFSQHTPNSRYQSLIGKHFIEQRMLSDFENTVGNVGALVLSELSGFLGDVSLPD